MFREAEKRASFFNDGVESMPSTTLVLADNEFEFNAASFLRCSLATVRDSPARHSRDDGRDRVELGRGSGIVRNRISVSKSEAE